MEPSFVEFFKIYYLNSLNEIELKIEIIGDDIIDKGFESYMKSRSNYSTLSSIVCFYEYVKLENYSEDNYKKYYVNLACLIKKMFQYDHLNTFYFIYKHTDFFFKFIQYFGKKPENIINIDEELSFYHKDGEMDFEMNVDDRGILNSNFDIKTVSVVYYVKGFWFKEYNKKEEINKLKKFENLKIAKSEIFIKAYKEKKEEIVKDKKEYLKEIKENRKIISEINFKEEEVPELDFSYNHCKKVINGLENLKIKKPKDIILLNNLRRYKRNKTVSVLKLYHVEKLEVKKFDPMEISRKMIKDDNLLKEIMDIYYKEAEKLKNNFQEEKNKYNREMEIYNDILKTLNLNIAKIINYNKFGEILSEINKIKNEENLINYKNYCKRKKINFDFKEFERQLKIIGEYYVQLKRKEIKTSPNELYKKYGFVPFEIQFVICADLYNKKRIFGKEEFYRNEINKYKNMNYLSWYVINITDSYIKEINRLISKRKKEEEEKLKEIEEKKKEIIEKNELLDFDEKFLFGNFKAEDFFNNIENQCNELIKEENRIEEEKKKKEIKMNPKYEKIRVQLKKMSDEDF